MRTFFYLKQVGDGEIDVSSGFAIEELRALHHDQVCGKVDTPRQRRRAHEHLHVVNNRIREEKRPTVRLLLKAFT